jgi:hypothetical protein
LQGPAEAEYSAHDRDLDRQRSNLSRGAVCRQSLRINSAGKLLKAPVLLKSGGKVFVDSLIAATE